MILNAIKTIVAWSVGIFLLLIGIVGMSSSSFVGHLLIIASGFLAIPYTFNLLNTKVNHKILPSARLLLAILLFFVGMALSPNKVAQKDSVAANKQETAAPVKPTFRESSRSVNLAKEKELAQDKVIVVSVTDGDTLRVLIDGKSTSVRLIGIDTPELTSSTEPVQCYSTEAKKALEDLVLNKEIFLEKDTSETDRYSRLLRYIWVDGLFVNECMAQKGYAFASPYTPDTKYQKRLNTAQDSAKAGLLGLWATSTCDGNVYTGTYKDPNRLPIVPPKSTSNPNTNAVPPKTVPVTPVTPPPATSDTSSSEYTCNCSKTCKQMSSCVEAQYQLNTCGCSARDGDGDGVACDSNCQ